MGSMRVYFCLMTEMDPQVEDDLENQNSFYRQSADPSDNNNNGKVTKDLINRPQNYLLFNE